MTYDEVYEWLEEHGYDPDEAAGPDDLADLYEAAAAGWDGRNSLEDIISLDDFIEHYS